MSLDKLGAEKPLHHLLLRKQENSSGSFLSAKTCIDLAFWFAEPILYFGPACRDRTYDLLIPNQARSQTALMPDNSKRRGTVTTTRLPCLSSSQFGIRGRNRTPGGRFWRPLLAPANYTLHVYILWLPVLGSNQRPGDYIQSNFGCVGEDLNSNLSIPYFFPAVFVSRIILTVRFRKSICVL